MVKPEMKFGAESRILKDIVRLLNSPEKGHFPVHLVAWGDSDSPGSVTINALADCKFISLSFTATVEKEGEVVFSSRYLPYFAVDCEEVTVLRHLNNMTVRSTSDFMVPFWTGNIPFVPETDLRGSVTLELRELKRFLKRVLFAAGDDKDPKHNFRCLLLECSGEQMRVVASDRRVVAVSDISKGSPFRGSFLLSKGCIYIINKLEGDLATLEFFETAVKISVDGEIKAEVLLPEMTVNFPRYETVLEVPCNSWLEGDRDVLLTHISDVRMVTDCLQLSLQYDGAGVQQPVKFYGREADGSHCTSIAEALKWGGNDIKISINAATLYNAVEQAGDKVKIVFANNMVPFCVTGSRGDYVAIVSPYSAAEKK